MGSIGGGEGGARFGADEFERRAEGWDGGGDEDRALFEGRGVEVGYGAVCIGRSRQFTALSRLGIAGVSILTGKVPICREDLVEFDCSPDGRAASDAAESEEGGSEPFGSSGCVEAHDHDDRGEDECAVCECVQCWKVSAIIQYQASECIEITYHPRTLRSGTRVIACSMSFEDYKIFVSICTR